MIAGGLIVTSLVFVNLGSVPWLGGPLILLAPTLLLFGATLLMMSVIPAINPVITVVLSVALLVAFGLNTRMFALLGAPLPPNTLSTHSHPHITIEPGQWVKLEANVDELGGRFAPFTVPQLKCSDEYVCERSNGFMYPATDVGGYGWTESVRESMMERGLSLAGAGAPTATVRIVQQPLDSWRTHLAVRFDVLDAQGKVVAVHARDYRTGLPFESSDGSDVSAMEYLLHANIVSRALAGPDPNAEDYPLLRLLESTFDVVEPQFAHKMNLRLRPNPVPLPTDASSGTAGHANSGTSCANRVAVHVARQYTLQHMRNGKVIGIASGWSAFEPDDIPARFLKDEHGAPQLYASDRARVACKDGVMYAVTDAPEGPSLHVDRIASFDVGGAPLFSIVLTVDDPRGTWSQFNVNALQLSGSRLSGAIEVRESNTQRFLGFHPIEIELR